MVSDESVACCPLDLEHLAWDASFFFVIYVQKEPERSCCGPAPLFINKRHLGEATSKWDKVTELRGLEIEHNARCMLGRLHFCPI